jgi:DNA phosphorothioation-dependent restriction protein DptG
MCQYAKLTNVIDVIINQFNERMVDVPINQSRKRIGQVMPINQIVPI